MGRILKNWRVLGATLFAIVIVVGAYLLARGVESPQVAQASAETALLQAIATKDADGDGLPDWEEALYGTDPNITDTFHLGMTDGEAVAKGLIVPKAIADIPLATSSPSSFPTDGSLPPPPAEGSLTDVFSKNFFTLYIAAKQAKGGADLSSTDIQNLQEQALTALTTSIASAPDFKSASNLTFSTPGADALNTFAASAEAVFKKNQADATVNELSYLTAAVENNDATALPHLASIAKADRDSAVGLAMLPVPAELAADDLMLINALMRLSEIISDFSRVDTDPLATMLALQQYPQATQDLGQAFTNIGNDYATAGVVLPAGTPGAAFVNLIKNVTVGQPATTQKP